MVANVINVVVVVVVVVVAIVITFGKNQRMFYLTVRLSKDVSVFYLKIPKSKEPLEAEQNWIKASSKKKIKKSFLVVVQKKFLLSI